MSNLLPVGTRVKIVGPDCTNSMFVKIGEVHILSESDVSELGYPYAIQVPSGPIWYPASSIQEIKEQTVKIENETQAKDTLKSAIQDVLSLPELSPPNNALAIDKIKKILEPAQAALAAYESRDKVKGIAEGLSDNAKIILAWAELSYGATMDAIEECRKLGLVYGGETNEYAISQETLGKEVAAYLRTQKRELKWEVHNEADTNDTFRCATDTQGRADTICSMFKDRYGIAYERFVTREVK